jgi:uncharacterized protein (DUF1810 family)
MAVTSSPESYNLERFVDAQRGIYGQVLAELRAGRKHSHWMWYIFPQLDGLGRSAMARQYAISSLPEAKAYLGHPLLGPRLRECARLVTETEGRSIGDILGYPDCLKFHSCMTLFLHASDYDEIFFAPLCKYFNSEPDKSTISRLGS